MTDTATRTAPDRRRVRRNRLTSQESIVVAVIAALAAVGAAFAGTHPTAWAPSDVVLTAAFAGLVTWAGATSPWWAIAGGAAVATFVAPSIEWIALGSVGFVIAIVIGSRKLSAAVARSVATGCVVIVLLHLDTGGFHGSSALIAAAVAATIALTGIMRRRHLVRRTLRRVLAALAVLVGLALIGVVVAAAMSYSDLRNGERSIRSAVSALSDGDVQTASDEMEASQQHLEQASDAFARPWALPSRAVPLLGQHVDVVTTSLSEAESLAATASTSVEQVNLDSLQIENGVIDINAIELLSTPLTEVSDALTSASESMNAARTDWLVGPLARRFDDVLADLENLEIQTERGLAAVDVAPAMLGRDGPRTYFVAFTTPAESRGLGGFMGTWAELRADEGRLEVVETGSTSELTRAMDSPPVLSGPPDYLSRYGELGAGGGDVPVAVDFWSNYTLSPDFPSVAEVAAQLYPSSGGTEIDGMIALDVETIGRFLDLTGPIRVEGPDGRFQLNQNNVVEYLLRDQYRDISDDDVRDEVLEQITDTLLDEVLRGSLPGPRVLGTTLGPAIESGRMVVWSRDDEEQAELNAIELSGMLPAPAPDGLAVVSNNAGANKLDAYLKRSIGYDALVHEPTGELRATATIRLANDAPDDLPPDAGDNELGLPPGTNRMYLSIYSPWDFTSATLDSAPLPMSAERELGWNVYSAVVDLPRGEEVEIQLDFAGTVPEPEEYSFTLRSQPLAFPDVARIDVRSTDGDVWVSSHEIRSGVEKMWRTMN